MRYTLEREAQVSEFEDKVVHINRCAKTVKGGRRMSFSALVVVGNKNGKVGVGLGKAKEVSEAIRKGTEAAQRNIVEVQLLDGTIPHDIEVKSGSTRILLMPAAPGTGVIAGAAARASAAPRPRWESPRRRRPLILPPRAVFLARGACLCYNTIIKQNPEAEVYLQSLLPVNTEMELGSRYAGYIARIKEVNEIIYRISKERKLVFVDLYAVYQVNNSLPQKYTRDGLHLNPDAYHKWAELISPYLTY